MVRTLLACFACLPLYAVWAAETSPPLDTTLATPRVDVDRYDLIATYEAAPSSTQAVLIIEQADDRNTLWANVSRKSSQLFRLADGRPMRLAVGKGAQFVGTTTLTVRRRPGRVIIFAGPERLAEAYVDFRPGLCGAASGPGIPQPTELRVQEIGDIAFNDDFFVGAEREGLWEQLLGNMAIDIYWDPKQRVDNRPIGACWFANRGAGEHLALTGHEFWDDYLCEVSTRPDSNSTVGLAFRVQDASNYGLLALTVGTEGGMLRLVEVREGIPRVKAESKVSCEAGHWYRLRAEVVSNEVSGWAADEQVGPVTVGLTPCGQIGVYTKTDGDCRFDDILVRGIKRLGNPSWQPQPRGPWQFLAGNYRARQNQLECRAASTGLAVGKVGSWADVVAEADVLTFGVAEAGVVVRWSREGGYGLLVRKADGSLRCRLAHVGPDGSVDTLSESTTPAQTQARATSLRIAASGSALRGFVNGQCVARAWDGRFACGEVGLITQDGRASFQNLTVFEAEPEDVVSELLADGTDQSRPGAEHGFFEPFIGHLWKPESGRVDLTAFDGEPAVLLHQAALRYYSVRPGDVSVAADVLRMDKPVSLAICSDTSAKQGYALSLATSVLQLYRNGQPIAQAPIATQPPLRFSLRRDGPFVIGQAASTVLSYMDPEPLPSGFALVRADGEAVIDDLDLGGAHALAYRFDRIEPDWIETSGEWLFHSGMACIPWTYWLSGDGRKAPAILWNRKQAPADLTLRLDVSEYTEGYESGEHQHFPYHDISLALSGDQKAIDSGYRFVIGAEGGRVTRLLRKGQVVAETADPRFAITMGSHCNSPRAIEVIIVKHGGSLTLTLNGTPALSYKDPDPLGAGWIALGVERCRANFRDLFIYRDLTWEQPLGVTAFSPEAPQ